MKLAFRVNASAGTLINITSATKSTDITVPEGGYNNKWVYTDGINPLYYSEPYVITLSDENGEICECTYSVNSYCVSKAGSSGIVLDVAKALYDLGVRAEEYGK